MLWYFSSLKLIMKNIYKKIIGERIFKKHLVLLSIATVLLVFACNKSDFTSKSRNHLHFTGAPPPANFPVAASELEVENQYKWIARGYVGYLTNTTKRNWLTSHLLSRPDYENQHDSINQLSISNMNIDLEGEIDSNININFTSNDYSRGYFYGFNFENCAYSTNIRLVDSPNLNLPWVVTYQSLILKDTVWGYFQNNSGNLDSIEIHSQNYEDYLIYCIFPSTQCSDGRVSMGITGGCNNNGVCEPYQGENEENCTDCALNKQKTYQKRLEVVGVTILEDQQLYDENWAKGRYYLGWDWAIAEGDTGRIHGTREDQNFIYNTWKRNEVKVCRKTCKGTPTEKQNKNNNLMYNNFEPLKQDIYVLFWENDSRKKHQRPMTSINNTIIQFSQTNFDNQWWPVYRGGSFYSVQNGGLGDGIVYVPKGSVWTTDPSNTKRHTIEMVNPSGEIKIKLVYFDI